MSNLLTATPCFPVPDIGATMNWYQRHLGFAPDPFPQHEPYVFCILRRDNIEIFLQLVEGYQKPDLYRQRSGGVWDAYISVKGVKDLYEAVRNEVEIVTPLHKQPYGQAEFEVKDPNGYVLVFGEEY